MRSIAVFCGSRWGAAPLYAAAAQQVGRLLGERGIRLVYGGGHVGLMGAVADAALSAGGVVIGVIPRGLADRELAHRGLTELRIVESMHERKLMMANLADAFIALPGGFGTWDELFEALTWSQLRIHDKVCGLLNVGGYYDSMVAMLERAIVDDFIPEAHRRLVIADTEVVPLLDRLLSTGGRAG